MNDTIYKSIDDLHFSVLKLKNLCGIITTVTKWLEDNHTGDKILAEFFDRMNILAECHGQITEQIMNELSGILQD